MQFILMYYEVEADHAERHDPAAADGYWAAWTAYMGAMAGAGLIVNGDALQGPHTATTVRKTGDRREVQDGPFADTKEHLGGYVILEVPDLDTALDWAAKAPCAATGGVEVRPVLPPKAMPSEMPEAGAAKATVKP